MSEPKEYPLVTYFMDQGKRKALGLTPQQEAVELYRDMQNCLEGGLITDSEVTIRSTQINMLSLGLRDDTTGMRREQTGY